MHEHTSEYVYRAL